LHAEMSDSDSLLGDMEIGMDPRSLSCHVMPSLSRNPPIRPRWMREGIFLSPAFDLCTIVELKLPYAHA
jgi:hypothetical protein